MVVSGDEYYWGFGAADYTGDAVLEVECENEDEDWVDCDLLAGDIVSLVNAEGFEVY